MARLTAHAAAQCEEHIALHTWHHAYFTAAGSPRAAAVYARAIAHVEHWRNTECLWGSDVRRPNKQKGAGNA